MVYDTKGYADPSLSILSSWLPYTRWIPSSWIPWRTTSSVIGVRHDEASHAYGVSLHACMRTFSL